MDALVALLTELWEEELVAPRAVLSVGPVTAARVVTGADRVGAGRKVAWKGDDLAGLLAAVRANAADDLAVWFDSVDLEAFEPAEEEDDEEVEDIGDEDDGDDDDAPAAPRAPAPKPTDTNLGEFEFARPSLCVYSVRAPVELADTHPSVKKPKRFGPCAAWLTLAGEDMGYLVDDLGDCWLGEVVEDAIGAVKVGKLGA